MMLGRCPVCHSHISLEAVVQDEAGREMLALLAGMEGGLGRALVGYIGLFRPVKRDLSNDRALRLMREALALDADLGRLAWALAETAEAIRAKGGGPLRNHNYLKRVLEGMPVGGLAVTRGAVREPASKTMQGLAALEAVRRAAEAADASES